MLPGELFDNIIDFLRSDFSSLCACSLVSRSWAYSARRYLFYRLTYPNEGFSPFPQLLDFLRSAPSVCPHVRDIALGPGTNRGGRLDHRTFAGIIAILPNISRVSIHGTNLTLAAGRDTVLGADPQIREHRDLRSLSLRNVDIREKPSYVTILGFLQPIRSIGVLSVASIWTIGDRSTANEALSAIRIGSPRMNLKVTNFVLGAWDNSVVAILQSLRASPMPSLSTLKYTTHGSQEGNPSSVVVMKDFIREIGPGLQRLDLTLWGRQGNASLVSYSFKDPTFLSTDIILDLSTCSSLKSLSFALWVPCVSNSDQENFVSCFNATLGALSHSPRIPFHLGYELSCYHSDGEDEAVISTLSLADWATLQSIVIAHPCLQRRPTIRFTSNGRLREYYTVAHLVRQRLPELGSRSVFTIC